MTEETFWTIYDQVLEDTGLREIKGRPQIIRLKDSTCPVCAVANRFLGHGAKWFNIWWTASGRIGLDEKFARKIAAAADNNLYDADDHVPFDSPEEFLALRTRLLQGA